MLKQIHRALGVQVKTLAKLAGVPAPTMSHYLNDRHRPVKYRHRISALKANLYALTDDQFVALCRLSNEHDLTQKELLQRALTLDIPLKACQHHAHIFYLVPLDRHTELL